MQAQVQVVDVRDAMGANAVNTMAEAVADRIAEIARGRVTILVTNMCSICGENNLLGEEAAVEPTAVAR